MSSCRDKELDHDQRGLHSTCEVCKALQRSDSDASASTAVNALAEQAARGCPICQVFCAAVRWLQKRWAFGSTDSDLKIRQRHPGVPVFHVVSPLERVMDAFCLVRPDCSGHDSLGFTDRPPGIDGELAAGDEFVSTSDGQAGPGQSSDIPYETTAKRIWKGDLFDSQVLAQVLNPRCLCESNSDNAYSAINQWIARCVRNHAHCKVSKALSRPRRLLQLDSHGSIRITESAPATENYIALSYCWGDPAYILKTTKLNHAERCRSIAWMEFPKTFQDAIAIANRLGIHYLWIDALCIIQDDTEDWLRESSNMGSIYEGAFLTIAASASSHVNGGCFQDDTNSLKIELPDSITGGKTIYVQRAARWQGVTGQRSAGTTARSPLMQRGWAMQERYLSRRILHYTAVGLYWECHDGILCMNGKLKPDGVNMTSGILRNLDNPSTWMTMIAPDYSQRHLTRLTDALPALSGLATRFAESNQDVYLAGIWKQSLQQGALEWRSNSAGARLVVSGWPSLQRIGTTGPMSKIRYSDLHENHVFEVLSAACAPSTTDPFGQVSEGLLVLEGYHCSGTFTLTTGNGRPMLGGYRSGYVYPDSYQDGLDMLGQNVIALCLAQGCRDAGSFPGISEAGPASVEVGEHDEFDDQDLFDGPYRPDAVSVPRFDEYYMLLMANSSTGYRRVGCIRNFAVERVFKTLAELRGNKGVFCIV